MGQSENNFLTGKLLLSMPSMGDPRFSKAAIYVCTHDEHGAMGLVINNTMPGLDFGALLKQLHIDIDPKFDTHIQSIPVMSGGPVETARGFVLHSGEFMQKDTLRITPDISVTGTVDAMKAIAHNEGPEKMIFALGYAGWSAGQLDEEICQNAWLITDGEPALVFGTQPGQLWDTAIHNMGIEPAMLSGTAGRA